jgi:lysophospholipase L1-like esterase
VTTGRRRRLLLAITLAVPWLVLLALELGLRAGGYGADEPLFVPAPRQPGYLMPNPEIGRRWFGSGAFRPAPELDLFRAEKTPRLYRIVFQGESSAQGYPYGHGGMPSRMLDDRLQATFPGREIEVVNTALTAVSSFTLLDQADAIVAQRPDAVLVYAGHNEYYGVLAGGPRALGQHRRLVRAYLALRRLRTVQLLANAASQVAAPASGPAGGARTAMQHMAGRQRVPRGSRRYEDGLAQFRANLRDLLARYRAAGIPVLIGTVASNERDQPPLASADDLGADSADVWFALARAREAQGDSAGARTAYREAKERDPVRFRAPEAVNRIIREEAARGGAVVVETQRALERASPGGVVGNGLMLEHLHPNVDGYFLIADAFYEAMRARRMIGDWTGAVAADRARAELAVTPLDSLAGVMRTDRLTAAWPFRRRGTERVPMVDTLQPRTPVQQLARAVVLAQLPWAEATERLRAVSMATGDLALAARAARALAQEFHFSAEPLLDLAEIAARRRDDDGTLRLAQAADARQPTLRGARLQGLLLLRRGDHAGAVRHLQRAAQMAPGDRRAVGQLRAAEALPDLEAAGARAPRSAGALFNLALAYALTEQPSRARAVLATLLEVAPQHAEARRLLERLDSPPD